MSEGDESTETRDESSRDFLKARLKGPLLILLVFSQQKLK